MDNIKEQKTKEKKPALKKAAADKKEAVKASAIDDLYKRDENKGRKSDKSVKARLQSIDQPEAREGGLKFSTGWNTGGRPWKIAGLVVLVAVIIIGAGFYWKQAKNKEAMQVQENVVQEKWYAIKLVNGEVFFGLVKDASADPLIVKNVYYDYDRVKNGATSTDESGNSSIRLVKRGKESYGPEGTLEIVRAQVLYLETLKESSKVLQAILENER